MKILAIESSCDETAAAVVEDGRKILSSVIASQVDAHIVYGGVVPEIASRMHVEAINGVVTEALKKAECTMDDIVERGPFMGIEVDLRSSAALFASFKYAGTLTTCGISSLIVCFRIVPFSSGTYVDVSLFSVTTTDSVFCLRITAVR